MSRIYLGTTGKPLGVFHLEVALELRYLVKDKYDELDKLRYETGILLNGLIRSIRTRL